MLPDAYNPEWEEIEPPPGTIALDCRGDPIHMGDIVVSNLAGAKKEPFKVIDVIYYGFANREDVKQWQEPGFLVGSGNGDMCNSCDVMRLNTEAHDVFSPQTLG